MIAVSLASLGMLMRVSVSSLIWFRVAPLLPMINLINWVNRGTSRTKLDSMIRLISPLRNFSQASTFFLSPRSLTTTYQMKTHRLYIKSKRDDVWSLARFREVDWDTAKLLNNVLDVSTLGSDQLWMIALLNDDVKSLNRKANKAVFS